MSARVGRQSHHHLPVSSNAPKESYIRVLVAAEEAVRWSYGLDICPVELEVAHILGYIPLGRTPNLNLASSD